MDQCKIVEAKCQALERAWKLSDEGGDYRAAIRAYHARALEEIQAEEHPDVNHVSIVAWGPGEGACAACQAMDGKVFSIREAVRHPVLPPDGCTCKGMGDESLGFCLCRYEYVFDDEV